MCGAFVALYADKLARKRRQVVLSEYFEHVLQLPLSFHSATHSGRLMKVMLTGTDTLWWLWLGFFREHFAAIVSIAVLLPLSLYLNWRLGLLLIGLSLIFLVLTGFVLHKTETLQKSVERYYSDLAERVRHARQCRAGAKLHPRQGRGALLAPSGCIDELVAKGGVFAKLAGAQFLARTAQ